MTQDELNLHVLENTVFSELYICFNAFRKQHSETAFDEASYHTSDRRKKLVLINTSSVDVRRMGRDHSLSIVS